MRRPYLNLFIPIFIFLQFAFVFEANAQSCNGYGGSITGGDDLPPLSDMCSATISYSVWFYRVDDGGVSSSVSFDIDWGDGTVSNIPYGTTTGTVQKMGANYYRANTITHTFPVVSTACRYNMTTYLKINGTRCSSAVKTNAVDVWDTDNEGNGILLLSEKNKSVVKYQICEGVTETVYFVDRSTLNCLTNPPATAVNVETRWIQFWYGTGAKTGSIPGIVVDGKTVTDNSGTLINNINGDGLQNPYFGTISTIASPVSGSGLITSGIVVDGTKTLGQAGKTFEITLRNWNYCNKYTDGKTPVTTTALIEIIDAPDPPVAASSTVCYTGSSVKLTASGVAGTTPQWYTSSALTTAVSTAWTSPASTSAGTYNYWVTQTLGSNSCVSQPTAVSLIIRSIPTAPTSITPGGTSGTTSYCDILCVRETGAKYTAVGTLETGTEFKWTYPTDWTLTASTANTQTYTVGSSSGTKSISVVAQYTDAPNCPTSSVKYPLIVYPRPTANFSYDQSICNSSKPILKIDNVSTSNVGKFTAIYSNGSSTFNFNSGKSFNSGTSYTHATALTSGTYTFYMTKLVDSNGCDSSNMVAGTNNQAVIKVRESLTAPASISGSSPVCASSTMLEYSVPSNPTSQTIGGATRYRWQVPSATANGWVFNDTKTTADHLDATDNKMQFDAGTGSGTMQALLEYVNPITDDATNFCPSAVTSKTVSVTSLASSVLATTTPEICAGTKPSITITTTSGVTPFDIYYTAGTSSVKISSTSTSPLSFTYGSNLYATTSFRLDSVRSLTAPGCKGVVSGTVPVTVYDLPKVSLSGTSSVCSGNSASITVSVTGVGPFDVVLSNGSSSFNLNGISNTYYYPVTPATTTVYTAVSVKRSNAPSCTGSVTGSPVTITVHAAPSVANAGPDQSICSSGLSATLAATVPTVGVGAWSYVGSIPSGFSSPITNAANASTSVAITSGNWGVYKYKWTVSNGVCTPSTDVVDISFSDNSVTTANAGSNASACFDKYTLNGNAASIGVGRWKLLSGAGTAVFADSTKENSQVTVSATGAYTFRWKISSGTCASSTSTVVITYQANPTASAGSNSTICSTQNTISLNGLASNYNASSISWTKNGSTSVGITTLSSTYTTTASDIASGGASLTLTVNGTGACATQKASSTLSLLIDANPVINAGRDTSICGLAYKFKASKSVGIGKWTVVTSPGGSVSFGNNADPLSTLTAPYYGTYTFRWTVTNGTCSTFDDVDVTFSEAPVGAAVVSNTLSICGLTSSLVAKAHSYAASPNINAGTKLWSLSSGPSVPSFVSATNSTGTATVTAYGSYVFLYTETNGACSQTSTSTVVFNQIPTLSISPSPLNICEGVSATLTASPVLYGGATIANRSWTGGSSILNATNIDAPYTLKTASPGVYTLNYTVTDSKGCAASATVSATINALAVISSQPTAKTLCEADTAKFSVTASGSGLTYQWMVGGASGYSALTGETSATLKFVTTPALSGKKYFCMLTTTGGCPKSTDTVSLVVNSLAVVSAQAANTAICENTSTSVSVTATGSGLTYRWQENRAGTWQSLTDGGRYSGTTLTALNLSSVPVTMDKYQYRCMFTTTGSCVSYSQAATLTVNALPVISTQPANAEVCEGASQTIKVTASGPGLTYQWQLKNSGGTFDDLANNSSYSGVKTAGLSFPSANYTQLDNSIYRAKLVTTGGCTVYSNSAILDVTSAATVAVSALGEVCSNISSFSLSGTTAANYDSLRWTCIKGSFTNAVTTNTVYNIDASYKKPGGTEILKLKVYGKGSCPDVSGSMTLTITAAPEVDAGSDEITCELTPIKLDVSKTKPTASNYHDVVWSSTASGILSDATTLTPTYSPSLGELGDINLMLKAKGNGSCADAADFMILRITQKPSANAGSDGSTCHLIPYDLSTSGTKPSASEYKSLKWTHNGNGTWKDNNNTVLYPTYIPSKLDSNKQVILTLTAYGNDSCKVPATDAMVLTIKPLPRTSIIVGKSQTCVSTTQVFAVDTLKPTPLSQYVWGLKPKLNAPSETDFYNSTYLTFQSTPYSGKLYVVEINALCTGDTVWQQVNSYASPVVEAGNNATICAGDSALLGGTPVATGGTGSYRYQWAPSKTMNNELLSNPKASPSVTTMFTLMVMDNISGCPVSFDYVTVTVNSIPTAPVVSDQTACFKGTIPSLDAVGSNIKWYSSASKTVELYSGTPYITGQTNIGTYNYYVTQTQNGCTSPASKIALTIYPVPSAPTVKDTTSCYGEVVPSLNAVGTNIKWYDNMALSSLVYTGSNYYTGKSMVGTYSWYVTETQNNCQSNASQIRLIIKPLPDAPATRDTFACYGSTIPLLNATGSNIIWYSNVSLTDTSSRLAAFDTKKTAVGNFTYYATQTVNRCRSYSSPATLSIYPTPQINKITSIPQTVCNSKDASITISAIGTAPMRYSVNGGLSFSSGYVFTGLNQGSYPVMVENGYGCRVSSSTIQIANGAAPLSPSVAGSGTYCEDETIGSLAAVASTSRSILTWYSDPNLKDSIFNGTMYFPTKVLGTSHYYVTQTIDTCESLPAVLSVIVNSLPAAPLASDKVICKGESTTLTATGTGLVWYPDASLSVSSGTAGSSFTPLISSDGMYEYWVTQTVNGCRGPAKKVTLTVNKIPDVLTGSNQSTCEGTSIPDISVSNAVYKDSVKWYNDAALSSPVFVGNPFATGHTTAGSFDYWVVQQENKCVGPATKLNLTIKPQPLAPIADDVSTCTSNSTPNLKALGTSIKWYNSSGLVGSGASFNTKQTTAGTYKYWATQTTASTGCESVGDTAVLTIIANPGKPSVSDTSVCFGLTVPPFTATGDSGATFNWFDKSVNLISTGYSFATGETAVNTYKYFVSQTVKSCESPKLSISLSINPNPVHVSNTITNETYCERKDGSISILATKSVLESTLEYSIDNGVSYYTSFNFSNLRNGSYPVKVKNNLGCVTSGGNAVVAPGGPPPAPKASGTANYCEGASVGNLTATPSVAGTITWYSDALLTTVVASNTLSIAPSSTVGVWNYYVTETVGGCEGPSSHLAVTVYPIPSQPLVRDTAICFGTVLPTFSTSGIKARWYSAALDTLKINSITFTPSATYSTSATHTFYIDQRVNGCASSLGTFHLIIHPIPTSPAISPVTICEGVATPKLACQVKYPNTQWYTSSSLSPVVFTGDSLATGQTAIGSYTYYVTQTQNNCRSLAASTALIINSIPSSPFCSSSLSCAGASAIDELIAGGEATATFNWYKNADLSDLPQTGRILKTGITAAGDQAYYVTQTVLGCESESTAATITIKNQPVPPVVRDTGACYLATIPALTAKGADLRWYSDATQSSTSLVYNGVSFNTHKTDSASYTWYVSQSVAGCESTVATQTLHIYSLPVVSSLIASDEKFCNTRDGAINITALGHSVLQYSNNNGLSYRLTNKFDSLPNGTYTITVKSKFGCLRQSAPVTINPGSAPPAPVVSPDEVYCAGASLNSMTASGVSGGHLRWYSDAALTQIFAKDSTQKKPLSTIGSKVYYVTDSIGSCKSPSSAIRIAINPLPTVSVGGNAVLCANGDSAMIKFSFTGTAPFEYTFTDGVGSYAAYTNDNPSYVSVFTSGIYSATYLKDGNGCEAIDKGASATVVVHPLPTAKVSGSADICNDGISKAIVSFDLTGAKPWNLKYKIDNDTIRIDNITTNSYQLNTSRAGVYRVVALVDSNTCIAKSMVDSAIVVSHPLPSGTIATGDTALCDGQSASIIFKLVGVAPWTLSYSHTNGARSVFTKTTFNANLKIDSTGWDAGIYRLSYLVDATGCAAKDTGSRMRITRWPLPTALITGKDSICSGSADTLSFHFTGAAPWVFRYKAGTSTLPVDSAFSTTKNIVVKPASSMTYQMIALSDSNRCVASAMPNKAVTVTLLPTADTTYKKMDDCVSENGSITITPTSGNAPFLFSITGTDNLSFGVSSTFTGLGRGSYPVFVKDALGCILKKGTIDISAPGLDKPSVSDDILACYGDPLGQMTATSNYTGASAKIFVWYSSPLPSAVAKIDSAKASIDPDPTKIGTTYYYVTEKLDNGTIVCESAPSEIAVTIKALPAKPTSTDTSICYTGFNGTNPKLIAVGTQLTWYNITLTDTVPLRSGNLYKPVEIDSGIYRFYTQQIVNGCKSPFDTATFIIKALPSRPLTDALSECEGLLIPKLHADTFDIKWYSDVRARSYLDSGNDFETGKTVAGTYTYYATQTENGCQSETNPAILTIHAKPSMPKISDITVCEGVYVPSLYASVGYNNVKWYANENDTSYITDENPYDTNLQDNSPAGTYTYYVSTYSLDGCESDKKKVVITIKPKPQIPILNTLEYCKGAGTPLFTATNIEAGALVSWYKGYSNTALQQSLIATFNTNDSLPAVYLYSVKQKLNGCESDRAMSTLTINSVPVFDLKATYATDETYCNKQDGKITLKATDGTKRLYYSIYNGADLTINTDFTNLKSGNYQTLAQNDKCEVHGPTLEIKAGVPPPAPVAGTSATYCDGDLLKTLTATESIGGTLTWYKSQSLLAADAIGAGNALSPYNTVGTSNYYVTETYGGCESMPTILSITINPIPEMAVLRDTFVCEGGIVPTLIAQGAYTMKWYGKLNLTDYKATGSSYNSPNITVGKYSYYVVQISDKNCNSKTASVTLSINAVPKAPADSSVSACAGSTIPKLHITGENLKWYSNLLKDDLLYEGQLYDTKKKVAGEYSYGVSQSVDGCESPASLQRLTIYSVPDAPQTEDKEMCKATTVPTFIADGDNIIWRNASNTILSTNRSFTPSATTYKNAGVYSFTATQTTNGCTSVPTIARLTINAIPLPPVTDTVSVCYGNSVPPLIAIGKNIRWYIDENTTIKVADTSTFNTGISTKGTYEYFATQTESNCQSLASPAMLVINGIPRFIKSTQTDETYCDLKDGSITISALGSGSLEYSVNDGVSYQSSNSFSGLGKGTYYIRVRNSVGCDIYGDTVVIKRGVAPPTPSAGYEQEKCEGEKIEDLWATQSQMLIGKSELTWYSDAALTDIIKTSVKSTDTLTITPANVKNVTKTYYATQTLNGCQSTAIPINVSIYERPQAPVAASVTVCEGQIVPNLSVKGTTVSWYSDNTLKRFLSNANSYSTGNVSAGVYTYYVTQWDKGCESPYTQLMLTINKTPELSLATLPEKPEGCPPLKIDFKASVKYADNLNWYYNNALSTDTARVLTKTFDNTTSLAKYTRVKLVASTVKGCSVEASADVNVYPKPDFNFVVAPKRMCSPANISLISKIGGSSYNWYYGDADFDIGTSSNQSHEYKYDPSDSLVVPIKLIATSYGYNCTDTFRNTVTILPSAKPDYSMDKTEVCAPDSIRFTNNNIEAKSYWSFGDGQTRVLNNNPVISHTYYNKGQEKSLQTELYVENKWGCNAYKTALIYVKPEISPNFLADTSGCSPLEIQFTNRTAGTSLSYEWNLAANQTSSVRNPFRTFENNTSSVIVYPIQLLVSRYGCKASVTRNIYVYPELYAAFKTDTDQVCYPYRIKITNTSSGACSNCILWNYGDGKESSKDDTVYNYTASLTQKMYRLKQTIWNYNKICIDTVSQGIIVNPYLKSQIILPDTAVCSPYVAQFKSFIVGDAKSYNWIFGDGTSNASSLKDPNHTYVNDNTEAVKYKYTLSVQSTGGCVNDTFGYIRVYPAPVANFTIDPTVKFFPDAKFTFKDYTNQGPWTYRWIFGDNTESNTKGNVEHTYQKWGMKENNYAITVQLIASAVNCADTATNALTLFAPRPVASFDSLISGCQPITVKLKNNSLYGESYLWEFDDQTTSNEAEPSHTFETPGQYNVKLTVTAEGGVDKLYRVVKVYPKPTVDFTVSPKEVMLPDDVIRCFNQTKDGARYLWDFGDGTSSVESDPSHKYTTMGNFGIKLIAWSDYECVDSLVQDTIVTVSGKGKVVFPDAFFPSTSGPGSKADGNNPNVVFRPYIEGAKEYHFEVYNRWGARVFSTDDPLVGWDGYYRGRLCEQGVYVYKAWGKFVNGKTYVKAGDITLLHRVSK